ncbi:hypothetical protein [Jeotgalibacillus aurantiacus]|uniref:hypothetical protein n=1 Tax=Jeotgalibacillus aurantiacus TaxID=2763266 RepID=UPI001D0A3B05|nr:hypothetical protein [Jeotgalibacillus aurantiacus]
MKTITITYKEHEGRYGHAYRSMTAKDAEGRDIHTEISTVNPVHFIEKAVTEVVKAMVANGQAADDFTIELPAEITLTAELQAHIADKLASDPKVASVVFG